MTLLVSESFSALCLRTEEGGISSLALANRRFFRRSVGRSLGLALCPVCPHLLHTERLSFCTDESRGDCSDPLEGPEDFLISFSFPLVLPQRHRREGAPGACWGLFYGYLHRVFLGGGDFVFSFGDTGWEGCLEALRLELAFFFLSTATRSPESSWRNQGARGGPPILWPAARPLSLQAGQWVLLLYCPVLCSLSSQL